MVKLNLKSDPKNPNWFVIERVKYQKLRPGWSVVHRPHHWTPPTDVYETGEHIVIVVEVAGMHQSEFSISLDTRHVIIRGLRQLIAEPRAYQQMEIRFGEFSTEVELPYQVLTNSVKAEYSDGFLRLTLHKSQSKSIRIRD